MIMFTTIGKHAPRYMLAHLGFKPVSIFEQMCWSSCVQKFLSQKETKKVKLVYLIAWL